MKFRSVNCLSISRTLKQLSKVSVPYRSQEYLFGHFLSKDLWQRLYLLKFHAFRIFFWIPLDGYVWSMRIILWYASYFGHSNNIHTPKPHCKNFWWNYNKNDTCTRSLGNKEQNLLFLVASQSDVHIEFDFASVSLRARSVFQIKFPRKIGRKEINLFSPEVVLWKKYMSF